jgi:hypothetical protein
LFNLPMTRSFHGTRPPWTVVGELTGPAALAPSSGSVAAVAPMRTSIGSETLFHTYLAGAQFGIELAERCEMGVAPFARVVYGTGNRILSVSDMGRG